MAAWALVFLSFITLVTSTLTTHAALDAAEQQGKGLASLMLTVRLYAERNVGSNYTGEFSLNTVLPAEYLPNAQGQGIRGYAEKGTVYVYLEDDAPLVLQYLSDMTHHSIQAGRIMSAPGGGGRVLKPSTAACRQVATSASCHTPVPSNLPLGAVVVRSGNT